MKKLGIIYVTSRGTARIGSYMGQELDDSDREVAAVKAAGAVPFECGSEIPDAPARGPFATFTPRRTEMTAAGPRSRPDGHMGRRAMRLADAFDVMNEQAARRHPSVVARARREWERGPRDREFRAPAFVPPFTIGQIEMGREYAALVERCAASGVKCASLEALRGAASNGGDREVAVLRDFQMLRVLRARIGDGLAKEVRRIRPGKDRRRAIRTRDLVDRVCVGGQSLVDVLTANGWADDQKARTALRADLCAALDRMRGYDLVRVKDHP